MPIPQLLLPSASVGVTSYERNRATVGRVVQMIEIMALPTAVHAALVVALVLLEAIVLYVGYGLVEQRIGPPVLEAIANA